MVNGENLKQKYAEKLKQTKKLDVFEKGSETPRVHDGFLFKALKMLPHKSGSRGAAPGMFHVETSAPFKRLTVIAHFCTFGAKHLAVVKMHLNFSRSGNVAGMNVVRIHAFFS